MMPLRASLGKQDGYGHKASTLYLTDCIARLVNAVELIINNPYYKAVLGTIRENPGCSES